MGYWERFPHIWPRLGGPRPGERVDSEVVQHHFGNGRGDVAGAESATRESVEYFPYVREADVTGL